MASGRPPHHADARFAHPHPPHPPPTSHPPQEPAYAGGPGPALPPIQHQYPHHPAQEQPRLPPPPPVGHYQGPPSHEPRDADYYTHPRSGHATPVNRSYSHDSAHQQHTPTTPAQPGAYPASSAPGPPPTSHMDHGGHHPYPLNGLPHPGPPPPPGPYDQQQHIHPIMEHQPPYHGPPPPQQQQQQPPGPPPMPPYGYGAPNAMNFSVTRKKQMRATQACEQCRQRKQKCDEGIPCSFCKENKLNCNYRDTPVPKADKAMERVNNVLEQLLSGQHALTDTVTNMDQRLRNIETGRNGGVEMATQEEASLADEPKRKHDLDDHRTAPHKLLLLWPSIRPLLREAGVPYSDGYVMEAEDRGIIRLFGKGESIDQGDGTQRGVAPGSPAHSDNSSESNPPTPSPEGGWGTGFTSSTNVEIKRSEPHSAGGLRPDGSLDLDIRTITRLHESYMKHIHIMHPFLDPTRLKYMFDLFISRHSSGRQTGSRSSQWPVPNGVTDQHRHESKRRRLNSSDTGTPASETSSTRPPTSPERSPSNAIIWLVMALGKICEHKEPLPGFLEDLKANVKVQHDLQGQTMDPSPAGIKPSPKSPNSALVGSTPPSTEGWPTHPRSRRSSMDGSPAFEKRDLGPKNIDIVPGMAYYAKAAEILGDQGDSNDLVHAQMFLLAGLYKGQLARVKESMSWITTAGRAVQILLDREDLLNERHWVTLSESAVKGKIKRAGTLDKRKNLVVLAFWSCLQLESDILAELWLPQSGVKSFEDRVPMPGNVSDDESYEQVDSIRAKENSSTLFHYCAQLYLRKRLNQVHEEMYGSKSKDLSVHELRSLILEHERTLQEWREGASTVPDIAWNDSDRPSSDILAARLRGKYYGARNVINRPFLDYALHIMPHTEGMHLDDVLRVVEEHAVDANGNKRDANDIHLFRAIATMDKDEIMEACKRCIDAQMKSTLAFDGIQDRLIVTNIHGTAHAQFGNMLVLSATYKSWLGFLVPKDELSRLLTRTIEFLNRLAPISKTCERDAQILQAINGVLFAPSTDIYKNEVEPTSASNSFTVG